MRLSKRLIANPLLQGAAALLLEGYIRLVHATTRWRFEGDETFRRMAAEGKPFVLCFWHNRILMAGPLWPGPARFAMVISSHRDGQLISRVVRRFNSDVIEGSTRRGGVGALKATIRLLRQGRVVGLTPDGPRGPRMRAKPGAAAAALAAGAPILPMAWSTERRHVFSSWDRFVFALPFGRGIYVLGEPIAAEGGSEALARLIEDQLNAVTAHADRLTGHAPMEPA